MKPLFSLLCNALNQAGVVETYRSVNQTLLLALDGTNYFHRKPSIARVVRPDCTPLVLYPT